MRTNLMIILFCSVFQHLTSFAEGRCEDNLVACLAYATSCEVPLLRRNCQKTCDACGIDLCSVDNGGCDHSCSWDGETAQCSCNAGFRLDTKDMSSCVDINECTEGPNPCLSIDNFYCVNTVGSYTCQTSDCLRESNYTHMNYYRSDQCCNLENSVCGITENIRSNLPNEVDARINMGREAQIGQWPWQGQLIFQHSQHCGATLITNKWMVGAAHCFTQASYTKMFVYLGHVRSALTMDTMETDQRQQRRIANVILHPSFDNYTNDIALIELDEPVFFNKSISPICLPCGEYPSVGDRCWSTGFGQTIEDDNESVPDYLQEVDLQVIDGTQCQTVYETDEILIDPELMLCAGYEQGGKDSCSGDSGGPLVCQRSDSCEWYLAGVTSFGRGCGRPQSYGVYVNVINYENWIRETLGDEAPPQCKRNYNPCRGRTNLDTDCYEKLDFCEEFSHYMGIHCSSACCELEHNEIRNCFDSEGATEFCEAQRAIGACTDPTMRGFVEAFCKRTCELC